MPTELIPVSMDRMLLAWALAEPNEWGEGRPAELHREVRAREALTAEEEAGAVDWLRIPRIVTTCSAAS
jgi:hypothetical protein